MGFSHDTYVGPYVRCAVAVIDKPELRRSCTNIACAKYGQWAPSDTAFCSRCGAPVGDVPHIARRHAVDEWDVREAIRERLTTAHGDAYDTWSIDNGVHLWKPNIATDGRDYHLKSGMDFYHIEIAPRQIEEEIAQFIQQFAAELDTLQMLYGTASVAVEWGIIQDYC